MAEIYKKTYEIEINGVKESIDAVKSLEKQLGLLDAKVKELENRKINIQGDVKVSMPSGSITPTADNTRTLQEEVAVQKELNNIKAQGSKLEAKQAAYKEEAYQKLLAQKDVLKDIEVKAKGIAAEERLIADTYNKNTMQGIKQKLADTKAYMQTLDVTSDKFKEMTKQANELNKKLLEMESAYGQFGRNVGNYKSAADGFKGLRFEVAGTVHEFDNAKQAFMTFKKELTTLQVKQDQGIALTDEEMQRFEELSNLVPKIRSSIEDAGKPMDNLMDTMQSFVALAQAGKGITAFFGLEDTGVEETIKNLVALQNAMQGLQTIQKQLKTEEGLGKYFKGADKAIDNFVNKLFGLEKQTKAVTAAQGAQATATKAVASAEEQAAVAAEVQTVATESLTIGMRVATVAARILSFALKAIGIGFLLEGLAWLVEGLKAVVASFKTAETQAKSFENALNSLSETYSELISQNNKLYESGNLSYMEYMTNQLSLQNELLQKQIALQREKDKVSGKNETNWGVGTQTTEFAEQITGNTTFKTEDLWSYFKIDVSNVEEAKDEFWKLTEAIKEGKDYFDKWGSGLSGWWNSVNTTLKDTIDLQQQVGEGVLNDYAGKVQQAAQEYQAAMTDMKNGADGAAQRLARAKEQVMELNKELYKKNGKGIIDVLERMNDEEIKKKFRGIIDVIKLLKAEMQTREEDVNKFFENLAIDMLPDQQKAYAQLEKQRQEYIKKYGDDQEKIKKIDAWAAKKREDIRKSYSRKTVSSVKKTNDAIFKAENELARLRVENMKDGLDKQLALLRLERDQKLKEIERTGVLVGELSAEINEKYRKKEEKLNKEHSDKVIDTYRTMWANIRKLQDENEKKAFVNQKLAIAQQYSSMQDMLAAQSPQATAPLPDQGKVVKKTAKKGKEGSQDVGDYNYEVLVEKDIDYTKRLMEEYRKRTEALKQYNEEATRLALEEEDKQYDNLTAHTKASMDAELRILRDSYPQQDRELQKHLEDGLITQEQYDEASKTMAKTREENEKQIKEGYRLQDEQNLRQHEQNKKNIIAQSNSAVVNNIQEQIQKLQAIDASEPVRNGFGIVNLKATKQRNNQIIESYRQVAQDIQNQITSLQQKLNGTDITKEQRKQIEQLIEKLRAMGVQVGQAMSNMASNTTNAKQKLMDDLKTYGQAVADVATSVISVISSIQDAAYEREMEELDKELEAVQKKYDEMDALEQEHADNMESLEDQIANSQGSARDRLIQKYMAEKQAQKEALAEKKKAAKEEEKINEKKEKLDKEHRKQQKKWDLISAAINTAMMITIAGLTHPFVPVGLAMMATAAAAGAAQIAAISAKNYGHGGQLDGGVAVGNRHRDGGIKVLGGHAEIEGGEYITNRITTEKNIDLLEYINSKKARVNIGDLIEFYGGEKVRKNVTSVKTKFADGGAIPTLSSIDYSDRLIKVVEDYSNRPVQVAVVDIIDRTQEVNDVKVLAGL